MTRTDMFRNGLAVALLLGSLDAFASDTYLCAQLDRIRAEEKMPAIGAGVIVPDPEYPQYAPLPWRFITCASGVEQWGGSIHVTESHRFPVGSISKPITGLMVSRVIASEKLSANPRLRWNTQLIEVFPEIATLPGANHCYDTRTVADLMAHVAGFRNVPLLEPGDEWMGSEPDPVKRRQFYVDTAVLDTPAVACTNASGAPLPQLAPSYSGGVIIATHMAEVVTGRSWEDLMRTYGPTTPDPGIPLHDFSIPPQPLAGGHTYGQDGIPVPKPSYAPKRTNAPAGSVTVTVPQMAKLITEYLDASKTSVNRWLPDDERALLMTGYGLSTFNRVGWHNVSLDTANFGPVARWNTAAIWHNGSDRTQYAETYMVPGQNAGMFAMLTADGPWDANGNLSLPNRQNALNKTFAELAALRLHYGDAAEIVYKQSLEDAKPTVEGRATSFKTNPIVDGRLTTKWSAPAGDTMPTITIKYATERAIDRIVVVEDEGQRIRRYHLEYQDRAGVWHTVAKNSSGKDLIFPHRVFPVKAPAANPPKVFDTRVAIAKRIRLRVLEASSPPRIVEIASASTGGARQRLPFWYRHGFEEVLSPPQGPRIDRPVELAPEIRIQ